MKIFKDFANFPILKQASKENSNPKFAGLKLMFQDSNKHFKKRKRPIMSLLA